MRLLKRILLILPVLFLVLTCSDDDDPEKFILSVAITPEEGGSVSPDGGTFEDGTLITLTAIPSEGYIFREWMGDLKSTQNPVSATMDRDMTITLVFVKSDEDNDGVSDDVDQCLNTPPGEEVDETGCSSSQIDTDGDGVSDDNDLCSDTPEGEEVDENGCPATSPIFLDDNGVTIKAYEWAEVGQQGIVNGVVYTIVDEAMLRDLVSKDNDVTIVCTTKVTDMSDLFLYSNFNQPIGNWDVSNVTDMSGMFQICPFNQPIEYWDVGNVTDMSGMFSVSMFNKAIGNWDVGKVTTMKEMFYLNRSFNQPIGDWNVSGVTDMSSMFSGSFMGDGGPTTFNQDIGSWDVSSVTDMSNMFNISRFNQPIGNWDVSSVTDMSGMFGFAQFNKPIGDWDVSNVTDMKGMFIGNWGMGIVNPFNQDITSWNVSNVTDMSEMFKESQINQDLSSWNVLNVTSCEEFSLNTPDWTLPKPNFTNCNPD